MANPRPGHFYSTDLTGNEKYFPPIPRTTAKRSVRGRDKMIAMKKATALLKRGIPTNKTTRWK